MPTMILFFVKFLGAILLITIGVILAMRGLNNLKHNTQKNLDLETMYEPQETEIFI